MQSHDAHDLLEHADWLARLARALCRSEADADDAVQEALDRAGRAQGSRRGATRPWLAGILRNVVRDEARSASARRRREHSVARAEAQRSVLDDTVLLERQRRLLDHVDTLPEAQRRAVVARYFEGRTPREIAREEGVASTTVRARLQRALAALRTRLDAEFGDRATWLAWLGPVASLGAARSGARAWGWGGAALLAVGAAAAFFGTAKARTEAADPIGVERRTDSIDTAQAVAADVPAGRVPAQLGEQSAPLTDQGRRNLRLRVRDEVSGAAVEGATVRAADAADMAAFTARFPAAEVPWILSERDGEGLVQEIGRTFTTDAQGETTLPYTGGLLLHVATGQSQRLVRVLDAVDELEVELRPAGGLEIDVVDESGRPVESPVPIGFSLTIEDDPARTGHFPEFFDVTYRRIVEGGTTRIQDPLGELDAPDAEVHEGLTLGDVWIDIPGVAGAHRTARVSSGTPLWPTGVRRRAARTRLVLPSALGALELEVRDSNGERLGVEGRAVLRMPEFGDLEGRTQADEAAIQDGRARWPQMAAGTFPLAIEVTLTASNQTWTIDARPPTAAGETRTVVTRRPPLEAPLRARLVDPSGQPLANVQVDLRFAASNGAFVRARTDEAGRMEVALRAEQGSQVPRSLTVIDARDPSARKIARVVLPEDTPVAQGLDLGEQVVTWQQEIRVDGRVEDAAGHPAPGALVVIDPGGGAEPVRIDTDVDGSFSLDLVAEDEFRVAAARSWSADVGEPRSVRISELDEPLMLVLPSTVDVVGRLDVRGLADVHLLCSPRAESMNFAELRNAQRALEVHCRTAFDGAEPGRWNEATVTQDTSGDSLDVRMDRLLPGTYEAALRIGGGEPFLRVPFEVHASGTDGAVVSTAAFDGIRLADELRWVEVEGRVDGKPVRCTTRVLDADDRALVAVETSRFPCPLRLARRASCERARFASVPLGADELFGEGPVVVEFRRSLPVRVQLIDPTRGWERGSWASARLEDGTQSGPYVPLGRVGAGPLAEAHFPAPGTYRLYVQLPPEPDKDGGPGALIESAASRRTEVLFEVLADTRALTITLPAREGG